MKTDITKNKKNEVFEKLYGRSLTKKEAYEIRKNLTGFFEVLIQIDQSLKQKGSNGYAN